MKPRHSNRPSLGHNRKGRTEGAPPQKTSTRQAASPSKILVPTDFSEGSKAALGYAVGLAKPFRASLTLLHVVRPLECATDFGYGAVTRLCPDESGLRSARSRLKALANRLAARGPRPLVVARSGAADQEIIQTGREIGADLIIMGAHADSGPAAETPAPIVETVLRYAPCPVVVMNPREQLTRKGPSLGV